MLDFIEKEKLRIEEYLKDSIEHQDKKVDYILYKTNSKETNTLVSDSSGSEAIEFTPYSKDNDNGYNYVPEWDYNFDYYIYNLLEEDWKIGYMTPEVHYNIWNSIHELYPKDIDFKDGVQNYLRYCKDNNITKEYLDKETNLDTPDVMWILGDMPMYTTIEYRGYIAEIDDNNYDSPYETLVNIYKKGKEDRLETVSLNKDGLVDNIKEYINDNYRVSKNKDYER